MIEVVTTNKFRKSYKLAKKRHLNIALLNDIIDKLTKEILLDSKYCDHELKGNYKGFRECHIQPDWILIYRVDNINKRLLLVWTGTHSDLF